MQKNKLVKMALLALTVVLFFALDWELFWRSKGFTPTFNDDKYLWATKRKEVYKPQSEATVFIGSSRIKFDLDIPEWRRLTGEDAVQLALVGTSPIKVLNDLADDENFKGKLVVDVTEGLFFSQNPVFHKSALEAVDFYKKQTPSEKISTMADMALEANITFLEERRFSLNTLLNDLQLPNRPGVFSMPSFPKGFEWCTRDRQTYMSDMFLSNPDDIKRQTDIWRILIMGDPTPPADAAVLEEILAGLRTAVKKIESRGGKVMFVRTPSSGVLGDGERKFFPRTKYWDGILKATGAQGIHFDDNPVTAKLICPEWSHLSPADAIIYTREFIKELKAKNWFVKP